MLRREGNGIQLFLGSLTFILLISTISAMVYFLYRLDQRVIFLLMGIFPLYFVIWGTPHENFIQLHQELHPAPSTPLFPPFRFYIFVVFFLLGYLKCFQFLLTHPTLEATRTPWQLLPNQFWMALIITIAALIGIILTTPEYISSRKIFILNLVPCMMLVFLVLATPLLLYPLGYGFDPFIHQATEKVIADRGIITPKPLYYIGQYSLVVVLSKIFSLRVETIDTLLLPVFISLYLLPIIFFVLKSTNIRRSRYAALGAIAILILPMSAFIVTTPQGLANVILLLIIFGAWYWLFHPNSPLWYLLLLASFATLFIHPLAGIPALFTVLWLKTRLQHRVWLKISTVIAAGFTLPFLLWYNALLSGFPISSKVAHALDLISTIPLPTVPNKFTVVQDIVYLFGLNTPWIILTLAGTGLIILYKRGLAQEKNHTKIFLLMFIILLINYAIAKSILSLDFLINYEQGDFTGRIMELSFFFLIPFVLYTIAWCFEKVEQHATFEKIFLTTLLTIATISSIYMSFPRHDRYITGRNYNLSQHDLNAVDWIKQDAGNQPHVVLSNQMVAAAALSQNGFTNYYETREGTLFQYPIPTSGTLYQLYLKMVYESPTRATMEEAMNLFGFQQGYFVLNDYWSDYKKIIPKAGKQADEIISIGNNRITIFKYVKN